LSCGFQCSGCHFARFLKDANTVVRAKRGATCTFFQCRFSDNGCKTRQPDKKAAGPVAGFAHDLSTPPSAAWFHDCLFVNNTLEQAFENLTMPEHQISIDTDQVRVLSNTAGLPVVYNMKSAAIQGATLVYPAAPGSAGDNVFQGRIFPTEADEFFTKAAQVCPTY
jgi:hypothetical protein